MENKASKIGFVSSFTFAWRYWSEHLYAIVFVLSLVVIETIFQILVPILTGNLVNSFSDITVNWVVPAWICAYITGVKAILYICRASAMFLWNNVSTKLMRKILTEAFDKVQYLSTEWHTNNLAGSTVRNISRGTWGFVQFGNTLFNSIYPNILASISIIVVLFWNGFWVGIVGVLGYIIFFYATKKLSTNYLAPAFEEVNQVDSKMNGILSDTVTCNSLVKAFATEEDESRKFRQIAEEWRIKHRQVWGRIVTLYSVQIGLFNIMEAAIVGVAIWLWYKGIRTPGDIMTIITSFQMAQGQMRSLGDNIRNLQNSISDLQDVVKLVQTDVEIEESLDAVPLEVKEGSISLKNVTFNYSNQAVPTYENLSVTIAGGEKVALVGYSGSGKSTFIKLMQRLYDVQSGEITIDGQDIRKVTKQSLRRAIALVPQEPILFHRSIAENISYAKPDATREEIEESVRKANAHDFIIGLPDGYDTMVGERGLKLSGGERQRLAIARAILANRSILVLDEATSSLDSVSEALVQNALSELMIGRTTIIIAHRLSTIKSVDRIFVFSQGKIVESGTHETLLANPLSHYRTLYSLQSNDFLQQETQLPSSLYEKALT
jgi:ATP-binding cassette subfamily B protein